MTDDGFTAFYAGSYRRLLGQLFAVTGDLAEAENILQEAYARAFASRLERLAAEATRDAVPREPEAIARRGRRRRRRQLAGTAMVVARRGGGRGGLRDARGGVPPAARQAPPRRPGPGQADAADSPETVPAAFHVTLDKPARVEEFHRALCGSRTTGARGGGLVVLEHARK